MTEKEKQIILEVLEKSSKLVGKKSVIKNSTYVLYEKIIKALEKSE